MKKEGLNGACENDLKSLKSSDKDKIEWIVVDKGKIDLRKSLVYCDETA